jgi:hypothetical protein
MCVCVVYVCVVYVCVVCVVYVCVVCCACCVSDLTWKPQKSGGRHPCASGKFLSEEGTADG